jgi:dynactin complex subunit
MAEFGSAEHVKSLSRRKLENLFHYVFNSRNDLNTIITQQSREIAELRKKVADQSHQLTEVQMALERRNHGELKARWQRAMDRYREFAKELFKLADRGLMELDDDDFYRIIEEAEKLGVTDG